MALRAYAAYRNIALRVNNVIVLISIYNLSVHTQVLWTTPPYPPQGGHACHSICLTIRLLLHKEEIGMQCFGRPLGEAADVGG